MAREAGMRRSQILAIAVLAALFLAAMLSGTTAENQSKQFREIPGARPSSAFPLGTDELGRDRLARLLFATRISLLLAPASALAATLLAALVGGVAGYFGGFWDRCTVRVIDMMLSLPWLFLLLAARALLPLNAPPIASLSMTYGLLALLGWAGPARVIRAGTRKLRESDFTLQALAQGCGRPRILWRHVIPNLKPVLLAQLWTTIPVFILAEANLGLLGLSASEPFPTWGNLLRDLQNPFAIRPEMFVPLAVMVVSVACFKLATPPPELPI
jgi:peptide/nickel transport system permease protein